MPEKLNLKLFYIFLLVFVSNKNIKATKTVDSLRSIWENIALNDSIRFKAINKYYKNHTFAQPDSVLILIDYHYRLAEEKNSKKEMSNALNEKSYAYFLKGDIKQSRVELEKSIAFAKELDDPLGLASVYSNLGNIYGIENKYQESVRFFYETLRLFRENDVRSGEARILTNIGIIYLEIDNYDLALDHFLQAIQIYREVGKEEKTGSILYDIGVVFYQKDQYEKAIQKGKEALDLLIKINNKYTEADCYFLLAKSYRALNQKKLAKHYVDKSLEIDQKIKNNSKIIERLTFVADLLFDSNLNLATQKGEDILKLVKTDTENDLKATLYKLLYKCYKAQGKHNLSLEMHEYYVLHQDSVQIEKNHSAVIREAIRSEFETKLHQNQIDHEKKQAQLKINHLKRTYLIILISIVLIALILFFVRKKIQDNHQEKNILLKEIENLKKSQNRSITLQPSKFELNRTRMEESLNRKINETDWTILNILLSDPVISNKEIAEKAFLSIDGIGSALRRMYEYFEIKNSKYKKISLLMEAIKLSNS